MTGDIIELAIVLIGLISTAVLFNRFPVFPEINDEATEYPSVSVIIPARNEEKNLKLLLSDLKKQSIVPYEIICVDDDSEDETARVADIYGVKLISLNQKPEGWIGKSWACQNGADSSEGQLLLLLDADVRMSEEGIRKLVMAYLKYGCTVSVQPYHRTEKAFEQLSLFFNIVQFAANGTALPRQLNIGLFGPVILISRKAYNEIGGHRQIRNSIVEDMELGMNLREKGEPFMLYSGSSDISFRMYRSMASLVQGWIKNLASAAVMMPLLLFFLVFFFVTSLISVPLHLIIFAGAANLLLLIVYSTLYITWVVLLGIISRHLGNFKLLTVIFYPVFLLFFLVVFIYSMIKRILNIEMKWKGRVIMPKKRK